MKRIDKRAALAAERLFETAVPKIEFSSDKTQIDRGKSVVLRWNVEDAEEAILWKSTVLPSAPEPLDWWRISELGEAVKFVDEVELTPDETTAYYLVAKTPTGMRGVRSVVEVVEEEGKPTPEIWKPQKRILKGMNEKAHLGWIERPDRPSQSDIITQFELALRMAEKWFGAPPPTIKVSANPEVIFEDESSLLSWDISNANCAESTLTTSMTRMVTKNAGISGTKVTGGGHGAGGMPPCALSMKGNWNISGQLLGSHHIEVHISARNAIAKSAAASQWVDILSIPTFTGACTAARQTAIRNAIKDIDENLRNGCIYNNSALNTKVAAFKAGHLNRIVFWARLLAELQNIGLDTFNCKDVKDTDWGAGHWATYTNEIILEWSPSYTPLLEYVILHELIHKCGFNSDLYKFGYSKNDIENQAEAITCACYYASWCP